MSDMTYIIYATSPPIPKIFLFFECTQSIRSSIDGLVGWLVPYFFTRFECLGRFLEDAQIPKWPTNIAVPAQCIPACEKGSLALSVRQDN